MARDLPGELAEADRHLLIAPAGHGKSRSIAEAVARVGGRQLVLTHTHAGVRSLRRHLAIAGCDPAQVALETIAGFATRWATPYPQLAEWESDGPGLTWDGLYEGAGRVLDRPQLIDAVARSYDGLFVDEYQDCTVEQHQLIMRLAERLPTRLVGDPLQGIFSFGNQVLVDFDNDVKTTFTVLEEPEIPWRWVGGNTKLGDDLLRLRHELVAGQQPDLSSYQTFDVRTGGHPAVPVITCKAVGELDGSVVVIRGQPGQAHALARQLGGVFVSMEESEGRDVIKAAQAIESAAGPARAAAVLDVIENCTTRVVPALSAQRTQLAAGQIPAVPSGLKGPVVGALVALAMSDSIENLGRVIAMLCSYPDVVVFRPEIPLDLIEAARLHGLAPHPTLLEAAVAVRERGRRVGRALPKRLVSRTLLVKGLEFDHAVVFDTQTFDHRNLYVALTRATQSVTIVT